MMRLTVAGMTSAGKVREHNEDSLIVGEWFRQRSMAVPVKLEMDLREPVVCLVADGMGGHSHGETASRMVAMRLQAQSPELIDEEAILQAIKDTNGAVYALMAANPEFRGMGSTVAGVVICPEKIIGFNIGDSRIYRIRHGYMQLLSTDDVGSFSYESTAERTGLHSHAITQSIGGASELIEVTPHVWSRSVEDSERFLLCTDGLTDMLDQDAMEASLDDDTEKTVSTLHEQALLQGGHDNLSIIVLDVTTDYQRFAS